ncbi:cutinase family protein [Nocardia puris]|uniref:cutinase family protein n=1 Tax=Nocardia puris TaxID=208602 RepID=UPI00189522A2|nr:cutinase family protein [Nocardia puris]MBF6212154.1 cutinase family protein [Nocardia puris]
MNHTTTGRTALAAAATWLTVTVIGTTPALADTTSAPVPTSAREPAPAACPALYVLGVQSGEEGAATSVDTGDTGVLGQAFGRLGAAVGAVIERSYIVVGAEVNTTNYPAAVATVAEQIEQRATEVIDRCPTTQIAVAGYAQGAAAATTFAEKAGNGQSRVPADKVAAVALLANPARRAETGALPGTGNAAVPSAAPGTSGAEVAKIELANVGLSGAGIAASATPAIYGSLVGRVADLCVAGDATCDVQSGSPLLTAVTNITAQTEGKDPVAAIATVAQALASTAFTTAVGVVNDDISGTSLDQLSYTPTQTLGHRIAAASSPTATTPTEADALSALFKIGTIGLNAVVSVAQKVFTATTIAELAAVGLSNPAAAVAVLGTKVADAVVDLVPPQSISTWVNDAFEAITSTITEPQDLYTTSATAQYSDSTGRRSSYSTVSVTNGGDTPVAATAAWFTAIARDLTAATSSSTKQPTPRSTPVKPTSTQSGSSSATTSTSVRTP